MGNFLHDTKINLVMGFRLVTFQSCATHQFVINGDQLAMLLLLDLSSIIALGYMLAWPDPVFYWYALPNYCLSQSLFLLLMLLSSKIWKKNSLFLTLSVISLSASPLLNALIYWDYHLQESMAEPDSHYHWWGTLIILYTLSALGRGFYIASGRLKPLTLVTLTALFCVGLLQYQLFGDAPKFWYHATENGDGDDDKWAEYRAMDAEKLLYRQPEMLASALQTLKPQRHQISDIFFVGFAPYATEDVFSKEVTFAKKLLDQRFDTQGHSINLINHLSTRDTVPLANGTHLAATLKHIGKLMDKDEDVLMLYLTSHGSEDPELSVRFWPLPFNGITPEKLRAMLDDAGIKWRVIIISACYSGGFIKALANDDTLVATAAAANKTSFGCGTQSEFTYFGEAVFKDLLPHEFSIITALEQARMAIDQREKREKITASSPQLSVGKAIKTKLEDLSGELRLRACKADTQQARC